MKRYYLSAFITITSLFLVAASPQQEANNYYVGIKQYNLSRLWRGDKITMDAGEGPTINFPEPLGFIGNDYHRFYIHYTLVKKDGINPYQYLVAGKTRVDNNICLFTGTITIISASLYKSRDNPKYKQGRLVCALYFKEDSTQKGSGYIKGKLTTDYCIDKRGQLSYDTINSNADGWENNQCEATWTSYTTHKIKKCNWGDWRIPGSGNLDIGAGEFGVNNKYVNNGWRNYHNKDIGNKLAVIEENRKWWK